MISQIKKKTPNEEKVCTKFTKNGLHKCDHLIWHPVMSLPSLAPLACQEWDSDSSLHFSVSNSCHSEQKIYIFVVFKSKTPAVVWLALGIFSFVGCVMVMPPISLFSTRQKLLWKAGKQESLHFNRTCHSGWMWYRTWLEHCVFVWWRCTWDPMNIYLQGDDSSTYT